MKKFSDAVCKHGHSTTIRQRVPKKLSESLEEKARRWAEFLHRPHISQDALYEGILCVLREPNS